MAKMKLDTQKLKQFLLQKAEVVAVGGAGFLALLLLVVGLMTAFGAGSPAQAIDKDAQAFQQAMAAARPDSTDPDSPEGPKASTKAVRPEWTPIRMDRFVTGAPFYDGSAATELKKRNPPVRTIEVVSRDNKEQYGQVTAYVGPVLVYDVDRRRGKIQALKKPEDAAVKAVPEPTQHVRLERLAFGEFLFPYREQVKDYVKALRLKSVEELFAKQLAPEFDGFDVLRGEPQPDGKINWVPIYSHDKDDKVVLSKAVERLLTEAAYDDTRLSQFPSFYMIGADTPFPKLAHPYHELKLEGLAANKTEVAENAAGGNTPMPAVPGIPMIPGIGPKGMPNQPGAAPEQPQGNIELKDLKYYPKPFRDRVTGVRLNPFSPYGIFQDPKDDNTTTQPNAGGPASPFYTGAVGRGQLPGLNVPAAGTTGQTPMGTGQDPSKSGMSLDTLPEKVLIRFVDAGLESGRTYQYSVRVRLKNPNFGKPKEVAYASLAEKKVLESPWVLTPPVTVPPDSFFYVVDQHSLATKLKGTKTIDRVSRPGMIPVQIHQLVPEVISDGITRKVADWVIAERLLIGRGELIGRPSVEVEVPVWDQTRGDFVLGDRVTTGKGKFARTTYKPSVPITFGDESSPVLADFWGGPADSSDVEALVLSADGKLAVRDSHEDTEADSPIGADRIQRYEAWRDRVNSYRNVPAPAAMPGAGPGVQGVPGVPGVPTRPKGPGGR